LLLGARKTNSCEEKLKTRHSFDTGKKILFESCQEGKKTIAITWVGKQPGLEK
jgi:hypothetical protein